MESKMDDSWDLKPLEFKFCTNPNIFTTPPKLFCPVCGFGLLQFESDGDDSDEDGPHKDE
jgi:hypothetical protein